MIPAVSAPDPQDRRCSAPSRQDAVAQGGVCPFPRSIYGHALGIFLPGRPVAGLALCLLLAACGGSADPVGAYFVPPQMSRSGPGIISLCYNRYTDSVEDLRRQVLDVCRDPRLVGNATNLDRCSLFSPVEARFECSHVVRSLAEERPQMRLDVIR